jgi:TatD DNase family protein
LEDAKQAGIVRFIQGGVSPEDWDRQTALKTQYPGKIATAFGLHPWWVAERSEGEILSAFGKLEQRIGEADALGETGLDHAPKLPEESYGAQEQAFRLQLGLYKRTPKPLVLHIVRAHERALEVLHEEGVKTADGLVHSFSASREIAKKYLDLGLNLSISGVICRKGFETLKRAVSYIPIDRLVLETDSPDQPPEGWARSCNEPSALLQVAAVVGQIRSVSAEEVLLRSAENLTRIFK